MPATRLFCVVTSRELPQVGCVNVRILNLRWHAYEGSFVFQVVNNYHGKVVVSVCNGWS